MKLDDIFALWEVDSVINRYELGEEALKTSSLHKKYYQIFVNERLLQKKYEIQLKQLKLEKHEFYTQGPTQEQAEKGWKLPAIGRILKSEAGTYVDADKDVVDLTLKLAVQNEKVELLESIIKTLANRNFNIRAAIDWERFKTGM